MKRLPILFAVALATMVMAACGHGNGETKVESITLARDNGGNPGETVETLKPTDTVFHATIAFDKGADAAVKADLIAVDTPEGKNVTVLSKDYPLGGMENSVHINYSLPQPWPAGTYKIDVYVNGKLSKTKQFMIQA